MGQTDKRTDHDPLGPTDWRSKDPAYWKAKVEDSNRYWMERIARERHEIEWGMFSLDPRAEIAIMLLAKRLARTVKPRRPPN